MTTTTASPRLQQRHDALDRANHIRTWRAELKLTIRGMGPGEARDRVAELLADPPDELRTMMVGPLLLVVPRIGKARVSLLFRQLGLSPRTHVGDLSPGRVQRIVTDPIFRGRW